MRIGVRELRQHASRYLVRVQAGEVIDVASRGQVIARLVPVEGEAWEQLVAAGRIQPAAGNLLDVEPATVDFSASERLASLRTDER